MKGWGSGEVEPPLSRDLSVSPARSHARRQRDGDYHHHSRPSWVSQSEQLGSFRLQAVHAALSALSARPSGEKRETDDLRTGEISSMLVGPVDIHTDAYNLNMPYGEIGTPGSDRALKLYDSTDVQMYDSTD